MKHLYHDNTDSLPWTVFGVCGMDSSVVRCVGSSLMVGSGSHVYGGVDWVAMGMSASENDDLRNPQVEFHSPPSIFCIPTRQRSRV